jgi:hypothetical protein
MLRDATKFVGLEVTRYQTGLGNDTSVASHSRPPARTGNLKSSNACLNHVGGREMVSILALRNATKFFGLKVMDP